jgi:hypothetical protein
LANAKFHEMTVCGVVGKLLFLCAAPRIFPTVLWLEYLEDINFGSWDKVEQQLMAQKFGNGA